MLERLSIRSLAVIDALTVELPRGFTVLTGETGAGKSILIDALSLAIGARGDAALVRQGAERAEVTAEFDVSALPGARAWLSAQALADEADAARCTLRRVVQREGRTRAFINDRAVGVGALRELGAQLLEIFGQHEGQTLQRPEVQRALLDGFGGHEAAVAATAHAARAWHALHAQLQALRERPGGDPARQEWLEFARTELARLAAAEGEWEALEAEHRQLVHGERILREGGALREALYGGEGSVYDQLASLQNRLGQLAGLHEGFRDPAELTGTAQAHVREAADAVQRLTDRIDLDPAHLAEVEQRMAAIHEMARKYREAPAQLHTLLARLDAELAASLGGQARERELEQALAGARERYDAAAAALSQARRAAAARFSKAVQARVRRLGLPHAVLEAVVEAGARDVPSEHGADAVRLDFSANPGEPPQPLSRVASGGELSRISLAIEVVALQGTPAGTMVFDEVDAGVGGAVAETVGAELAQLGRERQVLCVTHLAQVAAQGSAHLTVHKEVRGGQTYTQVAMLEAGERVAELSRMAGGKHISAATQAHARELLRKAQRDKG